MLLPGAALLGRELPPALPGLLHDLRGDVIFLGNLLPGVVAFTFLFPLAEDLPGQLADGQLFSDKGVVVFLLD